MSIPLSIPDLSGCNLTKMKAITCISWLSSGALVAAGAAVDFVKDVRPILEEHCFDCHGEDKQKSRMRLDSAVGILRGGESGEPFIVAGKSAESYLLRRVTHENPKEAMPPKGSRLTAEEVAVLRKENWELGSYVRQLQAQILKRTPL